MPFRPSGLRLSLGQDTSSSTVMRDLSAPVALSRKITGDDRHRWSYIYEWTSDQGLEWALKPPLQTLCGLAPQCAGLPHPQLVELLTFGQNRGNRDSSLEHDGPADPKMGAGAAVLVENGRDSAQDSAATRAVQGPWSQNWRRVSTAVYRSRQLSTAPSICTGRQLSTG